MTEQNWLLNRLIKVIYRPAPAGAGLDHFGMTPGNDTRKSTQKAGCPILDVLCQGWDSTALSRLGFCLISSNPTAF